MLVYNHKTMFDPSSRYSNLEIANFTPPRGNNPSQTISYVRRRFLPQTQKGTPLIEHQVTQSDRLDNITARYLGDPTQFWRICDANNTLNPQELEEIGRTLIISLPELLALRPL